jgi:adenine deaminase
MINKCPISMKWDDSLLTGHLSTLQNTYLHNYTLFGISTRTEYIETKERQAARPDKA